LHINNGWRDHNVYVMNPDTIRGEVLAHALKARDTKTG
jgi:hypothetical protein